MRGGAGGGWQGIGVPDRVQPGARSGGLGQLGARQRQQGSDEGRGTGGKMVSGGRISDKGWGSRQEMRFETGDGVPDKGWSSRHGVGFQTRDRVLYMGVRS